MYCVLVFFCSGPVMDPFISPFQEHLPFTSPWDQNVVTSLSDLGNYSHFFFDQLFYFPLLFVQYFMGLNVLILSYCRNGERKTTQLQERLNLLKWQ